MEKKVMLIIKEARDEKVAATSAPDLRWRIELQSGESPLSNRRPQMGIQLGSQSSTSGHPGHRADRESLVHELNLMVGRPV